MRRFYFENDAGVRFDLQNNGILFTAPAGLGVKTDTRYQLIGNSFVPVYNKLGQQALSGTISISKPNQYDKFKLVADFIYSATNLKLIYVPDTQTTTEYYRDVDITLSEKTEIEDDGVMRCRIQLTPKSLFYEKTQQTFIITRFVGEARYEHSWPARFNDNNSRGAEINNTGHVPAPIELIIEGYADNPTVTVTKNDQEIHSVTFPVIAEEGEKITFGTKDDNMYVYHDEDNLINSMDITNNNFFQLPIGKSFIKFASDEGISGRIMLTVYKYYKAV